MNLERKIQLLDQRIAAAAGGTVSDYSDWHEKTEVVLRSVMPAGAPILTKFANIRYTPSIWTENTNFRPYEVQGVRDGISLLESAKIELELQAEIHQASTTASQSAPPAPVGKQVFIVHGHDGERKHEVARFLRNLTGTEPVILHEQPDHGRVLIEKFEASAGTAGYAIVLLTADDLGRAKKVGEDAPRARQNVIFEMGFFFGSIGRERVAVLREEGVEKPSDVDGLVYTDLDSSGAWKMILARNMQAVGIAVDWSALGKA